MFRTTTNKDSDLNKGSSTYVTYLDPDRDLYKGGYIRSRDRKQAYEHEMVLEKDLKIPSRETVINTMNSVLTKNPNLFKESVKGYWEQLIPENSWDRFDIIFDEKTGMIDTSRWDRFIDRRYDSVKDKPIIEAWSEVAHSLGKADNLKSAIIDDLKKKGYNSMVDEASVGGTKGYLAEGIDPLIVFDSSVLRENKSSQISTKEEQKSGKDYDNWKIKAREAGNKNKW